MDMKLSKFWEIVKDRQAWSAPYDGITKSWRWFGDWITAKQNKQESCFQFSSVTQSCPTLCDPMNHSTPGLPVHHQLLEFTQSHIHPVSNAISSSVVPFSSCPQSLPASESFPMSQLFTWGGQSIRVSASASVLPMNTQDWSPLEWTGLDLLAVQGTLKSLLQHHSSKVSILRPSAFFTVQLSHPYMTTGKTIALTRWIFVGKVISLLFNMLSRVVITFFQGVSVF